MVDEAGPKVVAGEGEMNGWAHSNARDAAQKCRAVADLWGGNGRQSLIRSVSKGLLKSSGEGGKQLALFKKKDKNTGARTPWAEGLIHRKFVYLRKAKWDTLQSDLTLAPTVMIWGEGKGMADIAPPPRWLLPRGSLLAGLCLVASVPG